MPAKTSQREKNDKNKKLTDFFAQKPSASTPGPSTTSYSPAETSLSTTRKRPATRASTASVDRESSVNPSAPPQTRSASTTATRKRARSPESNNPITAPRPPRPKSPRKPMKIFQSDPHAKRPTAVVYVTSPFRDSFAPKPTALQVPHNTSVPPLSDSSKHVVCSSQSDEAELVLPTPESRDFGEVAEGVHAWREKASEFSPSSSPHAREDAMEMDTPPSSPVRGPTVASARSASPHLDMPTHSAALPRDSVAFQTSAVVSTCPPSPPNLSELPPLPPTPEPIGSEAKTAKLIAEIKARAFAATQSSDDEQSLVFRELEDSDDGELTDDLPLTGNARDQGPLFPPPGVTNDVFSSPLSSVPSTFNDSVVRYHTRRTPESDSPLLPTRTSTRIRKPAPPFRLPVTIAGSPNSVDETKTGSDLRNRKKSLAMNPLHALLREKELEEKRGTSCAALRLAEQAMRESPGEIGSDDEFYTLDQSHLTDEQAAWKAVHDSRKSTTPTSHSDTEDFTLGDHESKMLGAGAGKAINKILASDNNSKGKEKVQNTNQVRTNSGVPLWMQSSEEDMDVDFVSIRPLSGHPVLTCLDDALRSHDDSLVDLILRTGVLSAVPREILSSNIPQLFDTALFASSQIAEAVCIALRDLWEVNPQQLQIPLTAILTALLRLGASPSTLQGLGFIAERVQKNPVAHETFLEALKRLLAIVRVTGFSGAFSPSDVANVVVILLVMGLDLSTARELRATLNITINAVCNHGAMDYLLHDIQQKVLNFTRQLTAIDKARMVSFFASGSGRTRCIARRLAYSLITSASEIPMDHAPPLEPLVLLLCPDPGSCELFDVTNGSVDYEELGHYIDILSVALLDIAPYVEEERSITKTTSSTSMPGSPNKTKKPPVPPLELLRRVLEVLQSKIVDTRAAHLDRSRTKATIQRLTMRIYYDRMALMGVRPRRRESTLKAYFSPQRQ